MAKKINSEHAKALSKIGAAKGGAARAANLTPEQRKEIARHAAETRWAAEGVAPSIPRETHTGILKIKNIEIPCAVLEDGTRIISTRGMNRALGSTTTGTPRGEKIGARQLPYILASEAIKSKLSSELIARLSFPREYRPKHGGRTAYGHEAMILPEACEGILDAYKDNELGKRHENIVRTAELLIRGFARVGIIALIDEATGYQDDRAKDELTKILEAYIEEELRPYVRKFPNEFFRQVYRLYGWEYKPGNTRGPRYVSKFINKYIYAPLPPNVLPTLQEKNPANENWQRRYKHFQYLTENIGEPHLDKQLTAVTTLLKISDSVAQFDDLFRRAFAKTYQNRLPLGTDAQNQEEPPNAE